MPYNIATKAFTRIWAFVDQFTSSAAVTRTDLDIALDDVADGLNDIGQLLTNTVDEAEQIARDVVSELVQSNFSSMADAVASTDLVVGNYFRTLGYVTPGDFGGGLYKVVAAGTGTADGVLYINLTGITGQAKLQHDGEVWGEQAGAVNGVEASAKLQAAWNGLVAWKDASANDPDIMFRYHSHATLQNQLKLHRPDGTRVLGANIDFTGSLLTAVAGGDLSSTTHMILSRLKGVQRWGTLNGNQIAAGIDFYGMAGSSSYDPQVYGCVGAHITVRGASGAFNLHRPIYNQWDPDDSEYDTQANHTAKGIDCQKGDWVCFGAQGKWCGVPLVIGEDSVQAMFVSCHFFSGNNNYPDTDAFVDPVAIKNYATRQNHLISCYVDDGLIEDFTTTLNRVGCQLVDNGLSDLTHPIVRLYSDEADQGRAKEMVSIADRGRFSVGFVDGDGANWKGDIAGLDALYVEMAARDRAVNTLAREYNLYFPNIDIVQYNYKPEGYFQYIWRTGTDEVSMIYSAEGGHIITDGADVSGSFGSRSALVTWLATYSGDVPEKAVVRAGRFAWRKITGSTDIGDMDDFIPHGDVYADHFAPTETGLQEAAAYCAANGLTLHLAGGSYAYTQVDTNLFNVSGLRIKGAGMYQTTLAITTAASDPYMFRNSNIEVSDLKITVTRTSDGDYTLRHHGSDNFKMRRVWVVGHVEHTSGSTYAKQFRIAELPDSNDGDNLDWEDCIFDTFSRAFLKSNAATSTQKHIRAKNCDVYNAYTSCFGINSPNGGLEDFVLDDIRFHSHLGESVSDPGHYVGVSGPGVRSFTFRNLWFGGTVAKCIHMEEGIGQGTIFAPKGKVTFPNSSSAAAIDFQTNNNSGGIEIPERIKISFADIENIGAGQYGTGIRGYDQETTLQRSAGQSLDIVFCTMKNFEYGYRFNALTDHTLQGSGNRAIGCYQGFYGRNLASHQFKDNISEDCDYGVVGDEGAVFVGHRFVRCTNPVGALDDASSPGNPTGPVLLLDFTTEFDNRDFGAASTFGYAVMNGLGETARITGTLDTTIVSKNAGTTTYRNERETVLWDDPGGGAVLSATGAFGAGANCTVSLSEASDVLTQTASITTAQTNVQASCRFTGFAHLEAPVVA